MIAADTRPDAHSRSGPTPFPRLRWFGLLFLLVWIPGYASVYGWANFLHLCDIGVFLTVLGLWRWQALLLSSQAVGTLVANLFWAIDAGARLTAGVHPLGGTEYMWDSSFPLAVRLLSLFHLGVPLLQIACLRRCGYDRRGFLLQAGILALALAAARLLTVPPENINFVYNAPLVGRPLGPAPVHLAAIYAVIVLAMMLPVHLLLGRLLPASRGKAA